VTNEISIDLSKLDDITIDGGNKTARVGGGCKLGKVDLACEKYGLATTFGTNPDTGVGGLSLGGGFGFMARKYGFTVDNILEAEVVLQDGKRITREIVGVIS
jgi:FAD/FMN-containing dehydrogenase